jgi:hypothetical protein
VPTRTYAILGVPCDLTAADEALDLFDATYGAFREDGLVRDGAAFAVEASPDDRLGDLFRRALEGVSERLVSQGVYPIHAGALTHETGAVILSGQTQAGKTTLTLGLLRRGLGLLSDDLAISAADGRSILPYRRAVHIRPGTPELIQELSFLRDEPSRPLGGGNDWALLPAELERIFPGCLAQTAPLRHIVLLAPRDPDRREARLERVAGGVTAVELLRSTPATAFDFAAALGRIVALVEAARCVRLHPGSLESSVEAILAWLDDDDDG